MAIFRSIIAVGLLCSAAAYSADVVQTAPAILDDFDDYYGGNPNQTTLGEVYGSITYAGQPWEGGGYWYTFDDGTSTVKNEAGEKIVPKSNEASMIPDKALHVVITTSTTGWGAGVGCNLIAEGLDYLDLSKMTALTMKVKGTGEVRVEFETKDYVDGGYDWGKYGAIITLPATLTTVTIPVAEIIPEEYSDMDKAGKIWSNGSSAVRKFSFQCKTGKNADLYVDDIALTGMTYADFGWTTGVKPGSYKSVKNPDAFSVSASSIAFKLPQTQNVKISIHDMLGNQIRSVFTGSASAKTINWNSNNLPSGNYLAVLSSKNGNYTQPIIITK